MEEFKREHRKDTCRCDCLLSRIFGNHVVRLAILLVTSSALVYGALYDHGHSSLYGTQVVSLIGGGVNQSCELSGEVCGQLTDQESYDLHIRKHANLKIKLLLEQDGAPFLQSQQPPRFREITIVTQTSLDRWPNLEKMATAWGGALCVAVHVKTRAEIGLAREKMMWLHDRIEAQHHCRLYLQMVMEEGFESETDALTASYPVNALRNVALSMATTELVFLLDVDFEPSPRLHEKLTTNETVYSKLIHRSRNESQVLVVPVFQTLRAQSGVEPSSVEPVDEPIPKSMQELRERWRNTSLTSFRRHHPISHEATSYSHFLHPLTTEPFHVRYRELYEPYFIAAQALIPKFDERFRGYGKNKVSHAYNCAAQGLQFVVLPEVYAWEIPHPRSEFFYQFVKEKNDPSKSAIMNVVYKVFKEELQTKLRQTSASSNQSDSGSTNDRHHRLTSNWASIHRLN